MSQDFKAEAQAVNQRAAALYKASTPVMSAFSQLASATMKDGAMPKKTKELMAVAISVAIRCEGCIVYHTQAAIKAGASREEFLETLNVSIELGGGPATVYGAKALAAFEQLST